MKLSRVPNEKFQTAYCVINAYIDHEFGNVKPEHVRAITQAVFESIPEGSLSLKKWDVSIPEEDQIKLLSAAQSIIVSSESPWNPTLNLDSEIQRLFFNAIRGQPISRKDLKNLTLLKAVVWKKNDEMLKESREFLQALFTDMYTEISNKKPTAQQSFHYQVMITDLLSLFPFLAPQNEETIQVPVLVNGKWKFVSYEIEKIPLTPSWMGSPLVAYGLKPIGRTKAPPQLLFKGTTYPTDEGFLLSLVTDLNPGGSVGSYAFVLGKRKIHQWLKENTKEGKKKAEICGKSLGGALAWRTALYCPEYVNTVMAHGAPGFSTRNLHRLKEILSRESPPQINMFYQKNDLIPYVDLTAKIGVHYYQVLGAQERTGVLAHADMFSTHKNSAIIRLEGEIEAGKWKRKALTTLRAAFSVHVFPILILGTAVKKSYSVIRSKITRR